VTKPFIPPHPPRQPRPVHTWRGFFGERARTAVYGWSELAFNADYFKRNILGHTVHVVLKPEWVQRVLLDNAVNYEKPKLVKRILAPTIGRGLLSSDGELWRAQASPRRRSTHWCRSSRASGRRWRRHGSRGRATWRSRRRRRR
jgi:hypothetical protein